MSIVSETIIFQFSGRRDYEGKNRGRIPREHDAVRVVGYAFPRGTSQELSTKGSFDVIKKVSPAERTEEIKRYPRETGRNCT